jgi:hypothetical protein
MEDPEGSLAKLTPSPRLAFKLIYTYLHNKSRKDHYTSIVIAYLYIQEAFYLSPNIVK